MEVTGSSFDIEAPQTYVSSRPQWGKLLQASDAGRGQTISNDDDAQFELHALPLLLLQGVGVRIGES
jgi:hypothetical protein